MQKHRKERKNDKYSSNGYGTVGSGVVEVIRTNGSLINEKEYRMRFM